MHPGHAKKPFKKTAHTTTWLGHRTADVQQFFFSSVLANFSIVRASVFSGFNNLKVMVVSFFPPCHFAFVFQRALCLRPGPALIFRIGHELLDAALAPLSQGILPLPFQSSPTPLPFCLYIFSSSPNCTSQQPLNQDYRCE